MSFEVERTRLNGRICEKHAKVLVNLFSAFGELSFGIGRITLVFPIE